MATLPPRFVSCIVPFAAVFRQRRTWHHALVLLAGALLAPGARTVASALRVLGRAGERHFCTYHRVLSRAAWSPRAASRVLLGLLLRTFVPTGPIVLALDDTLERRRGRRITAARLYHDPVRSSRTHRVTTSGLRWLSVMLLVSVPWARRVWALPVLTALAPGAPPGTRCGRRPGSRARPALDGRRPPKRLAEWARQLLRQIGRWLDALAPGRPVIAVADASYAALELLAAVAPRLTYITRLRLDARLHAPPPPRRPGTPGRPPHKGPRLPTLAARLSDPATVWTRVRVSAWYGAGARPIELASDTALWYSGGQPVVPLRWVLLRDPTGSFPPQALLSTDLTLPAPAILAYYVQRWAIEVTFAEARRHLGLETQRQWSARAIARTTPVLLALVSLVTLCARTLAGPAGQLPPHRAAWYPKPEATFSDALGLVRRHWWRTLGLGFVGSRRTRDPTTSPPPTLLRLLTEALCYAA
ncbi:MAG TPA: transposase [Gemmatimonadaceae bacterium]|jgi:hypothetical protein